MTELKPNEVAENTVGKIEVKYTRPKFAHRVLANFIDIIIFVICFFALFIGVRAAISSADKYKAVEGALNKHKTDSGMYVIRDGTYVDVVSYLKSDSTITTTGKINKSVDSIDKFFVFEQGKIDDTKYETIVEEYDERKLNATSDGHHLFIKSGDKIIVNNLPEDEEYFLTHNYVYLTFYFNNIDNYFQGYFATTPVIYDLTKQINTYLIWVEIPISYICSTILVYFVPTLFFRRTRYTLGKALYRIGTVDPRFLSVSFGRNAAKWAIFLLEMILGVFSLGVIFICSFSMMVFSKKKQGFPDYMMNLQEVDCSKNKIYKSYIEIQISEANPNKKPTDFKLIDND